MKTITKFLGGVLILLLLLTISPLSRQAHAAAVTINITGITNHSGAPIPVGSYYQLIRSADSAAGAPDSTGLPVGDTVVSSGTISTAGSFSGVASIASNNYIYIRVWETWNGSSSPVAGTYYGTSAPANVGAGFVYAYAPAGFSTTQRTPIPTPIITITPATLNPTVTQGQNAAAQSFTVGNSGTAPLTGYTVVSDVAWMTINPTGGTIAVGGAAVSHTITYNTAALTANAVGRITISAAEATTQTLTVNLTVNPPAAPTITTSSLPSGTVGIAYSQALAATGGTTPYTWSISAGTLPAGLTLSSAGVISGSPTTAQTASFT
ncbi:hypothetical protein HZB07_03175, partial [Candidatus Saganbacteria bacterium]|nr:hypothetical protein [Candidatus Saganbacteria bacterium]